jgi:GAF domain-containing protein
MDKTALEAYKQLVEEQGQALLDVIRSVAMGDLDVEVQIPEGVEILSDLAVGISIMVGDLQEMMDERVRTELVEQQSRALLGVVQSVALGNLDVKVEVPEGAEVLSELAISIEMMVDDLREMMAEQERARAEIEDSRQQLALALDEVLATQRRYLGEEWQKYTAPGGTSRGYARDQDREGPADDAWLPAMTQAVEQGGAVTEIEPADGTALAIPISLYGEVIGAMGFRREGEHRWREEEIETVEAVVEQVGWALESQRLFDKEQQARALLGARVGELDCLNDIGRKIDEAPPVAEFLEWLVDRIPAAMRYPDLCVVSIELEDQVHGVPEARGLSCQIVQGLQRGGEQVGKVTIAYTEERGFIDEESALLGDIARRISGYIENRRLFEQTQTALSEAQVLYRVAQTLSHAGDQQEMFESVLTEYLGYLGLPQGGLLLNDEDGQTGTLVALVSGGRVVEAGRRIPLVGNPPTEQMIATKKPVVINDAAHSALVQPVHELAEDLGYKSLLLVPIVMRGEVIGALGADATETAHEFTEREVALVQAVADQLSVTLENRRLFQETQAALAEVETAHRSYLRREWQDHLRQRDVLERSAFVYDRTGSGPEAAWSAVPDLWRPEMDLAMRAGRPVTEPGGDEQEGASLAMPITVRGQTIGVLGVEAPGGDRQWTEEDLAFVEAIGDQLAQTLETARLFADTQRTAERERLIGEITAKIRASTDMHHILQTAAVELGQTLGTSRALIRAGLEGLEVAQPAAAPGGDGHSGDGGQAGEPLVQRE